MSLSLLSLFPSIFKLVGIAEFEDLSKTLLMVCHSFSGCADVRYSNLGNTIGQQALFFVTAFLSCLYTLHFSGDLTAARFAKSLFRVKSLID